VQCGCGEAAGAGRTGEKVNGGINDEQKRAAVEQIEVNICGD
jgi:hypothetical protein